MDDRLINLSVVLIGFFYRIVASGSGVHWHVVCGIYLVVKLGIWT